MNWKSKIKLPKTIPSFIKPKEVTHQQVTQKVGGSYRQIFQKGGLKLMTEGGDKRGAKMLVGARLGYIFGNLFTLGLGNIALHYRVKSASEKTEFINAVEKYLVNLAKQTCKEFRVNQRNLEDYLFYVAFPGRYDELPTVNPDNNMPFHLGWERFKEKYAAQLQQVGIDLG